MPRAFALRDAPPASAPSPHALARAELDALVDAFDDGGEHDSPNILFHRVK